ncbi:MAG: hypothetical protein ACYC35_01775 [Pirellulales bacterium]
MKPLRVPLHIVFYKEDNDWVAHCLEFDLVGDGHTKEDAVAALSAAIRIQAEESLKQNNPANLFSPADGKYFQMFAAGTDSAVGEFHLNMESVLIESAEAREYCDESLVPQ